MMRNKTTVIYSKNAAYQKFEVLKTNRNKRHRYGEFITEGVRNINAAVNCGWRINSFIYANERKLSRWAEDMLKNVPVQINYALGNNLMDELSGKTDTSELMAIVSTEAPAYKKPQKNPVFVLFHSPSNKGNLGTLLRSCDAFGVDRLVLTGRGVDIYAPEVVGSSMGSFFNVPFLILTDNNGINNYIADLKREWNALKIIATSEKAEPAVYETDMTTPVLLLIGNEKDGLSRFYEDLCDMQVKIPMHEKSVASSLNVSCAATALLYEVCRQRAVLSH